jgi:hypothetical protein
MMRKIVFILTLIFSFNYASANSYSYSGCYTSEADAWRACNQKYNGKCRYLGKDYKVCDNYVVKSGDTLSKIASSHNMSLGKLLNKNKQYINREDSIAIGDKLYLP